MKLLILSSSPIPEVEPRHVEDIKRCATGYDIVITDDRERQFEEIVDLAEHAFALLLGLTRGVHHALRNPSWATRSAIRRRAWELADMTMGIVGLGGTGVAVAERAHAFGMRVLAVDPEPVPQPSSAFLGGSPSMG